MIFPRMLRPRHSRVAIATAVSLLLITPRAQPLAFVSYLPPDEAAQGWIRLFDGTSRFGWTSGSGEWQVNANALVSDPAQSDSLRTTASFSDFDLKFEARITGLVTLLMRADPESKPAQLRLHALTE